MYSASRKVPRWHGGGSSAANSMVGLNVPWVPEASALSACASFSHVERVRWLMDRLQGSGLPSNRRADRGYVASPDPWRRPYLRGGAR